MFSGGREWFCPNCEADGSYPADEGPRRVQMLRDGRHDELRQEMREHLDAVSELRADLAAAEAALDRIRSDTPAEEGEKP